MGKYWLTTLGCPKNQVDSDRLASRLETFGYDAAAEVEDADVVVVNTCAFIEAAREESIETIFELSNQKSDRANLVVTGCMAQRYGNELAQLLPEVDMVAGFGKDFISVLPDSTRPQPIGNRIERRKKTVSEPMENLGGSGIPAMDLLNLPRSKSKAPWAYVKVAEGCDKACGFCAIPSFRGKQSSRRFEDVLGEVESLQVKEAVLVAQDLANYGRDIYGENRILELYKAVSGIVDWVRMLYLYPSGLTDPLIEEVCASPVPYFDLSLQHVSADHLRRMRRVGARKGVLNKLHRIRSLRPDAVFRSSFILGYPGETDEDQRELREFIEEAELDWAGFFAYSNEEGTYSHALEDQVDRSLALERLNELSEIQDGITRRKRMGMIGRELRVLTDRTHRGRSFAEAPEIDGIIDIDGTFAIGEFIDVRIVDNNGPDLVATLTS